MTGTLYGIGVGPGDPELITLKAARRVKAAAMVAYVVGPNGTSLAYTIAAEHVHGQAELPIRVPMSKDRSAANGAYEQAAQIICAYLTEGRDVAVLCEGDPLFYGSFTYLHDRLGGDFPCEVIPGIPAFTAAGARAALPLARQSDRLAVVSSRNTDTEIATALRDYDSVVIMKAGPARDRLRGLIHCAGRAMETVYLERVGWADECVYRNLAALPEGPGPYFSMFIVCRGRR